MNTAKWFDRKFDFNINNKEKQYQHICERLGQIPKKLEQLVAGSLPGTLTYKPGGKWSVQEHIGHLYLLESLWQQRIYDIRDSKPVLTAADLENKATSEAGFNNDDITTLVKKFTDTRNKTLSLLENISNEDKMKTSLHPRLQQPMRIIDNIYFAAEHDDHHLEKIREIISLSN